MPSTMVGWRVGGDGPRNGDLMGVAEAYPSWRGTPMRATREIYHVHGAQGHWPVQQHPIRNDSDGQASQVPGEELLIS